MNKYTDGKYISDKIDQNNKKIKDLETENTKLLAEQIKQLLDLNKSLPKTNINSISIGFTYSYDGKPTLNLSMDYSGSYAFSHIPTAVSIIGKDNILKFRSWLDQSIKQMNID